MYASVEQCQGGFLIEVRNDSTDPTLLVMQFQRDFKKVVFSWQEVETVMRELFMGKNYQPDKIPVVVDHGKQ